MLPRGFRGDGSIRDVSHGITVKVTRNPAVCPPAGSVPHAPTDPVRWPRAG
jgi:hypothetical protein